MTPSKAAVVQALRQALTEELAGVERMAQLARDEATSSETKSEGKYDTRATEASYLARGQAERIIALRKLLSWYDFSDRSVPVEPLVVKLGALVVVQAQTRESLFLAPVGGGCVDVNGSIIRVISLSSPLGQALLELEEGDGAEVDTPRGIVDIEVLSIV